MNEEVLQFGQHSSKVGIVTYPDGNEDHLPAVILINAGLIHHIGPHRLYVKLARQLAGIGFTSLRFDLSGVGDSSVRDDNLSIDKSAFSDIEEAIHSLTQTRHMREYILVGHCSGAIHSFMSANKDNRIVGAVIINPEGDDQGWGEYDRKRKLARYYQNYYSKEAFTDRSRWVKLLTGKASYRSILRNLFQNILWNRISGVIFRFKKQQEPTGEKAPETNPIQLESLESLRSLSKKDKPLLFVYTEGGTGLERFRLLLKNELDGLDTAPIFSMQTISGSDHLFTPRPAQDNLIQTIKSWIEEKFVSAYVSDSI